ncbi:MAG TPA: dTDP-4-dehydrorhamnose 3,5-epimerase [Gemmatimonadales bacterium]|nr:dTDP-4-dehydrorhamnose 3,5-epimerase [Gemmatimonadales bacterium]
MIVEVTALPGVLLLVPRVFGDPRGYFLESFNRRVFQEAGLPVEFVQDNHSRSRAGVLRGLHYQLPHPQGKLVRVARGRVFDVAADIRVGSPTFGRWVGVELSDENARMLWVPPGFAHGFCALSDPADVAYKCTELYHPEGERGVRWDDPDLAIEWPVHDPLLSPKDAAYLPLGAARDDLPRYAERHGE